MSYLNHKDLTDLWAVARILCEANFDEASDDEKVDIFLKHLSKRPLQKAYCYEKAKTVISEVIEKETGEYPSKGMQRKIKNWTTRTARESGKSELQYPKVK